MARPKAYERTEIIDIAMKEFWIKGYFATSLADLTEATGLNKRSLYNEFGNKEQLFNVCLERYNESRSHQVAHLFAEPLGTKNIERFFNQVALDSSKRGCLFTLSILEKELLGDEAKAKVENDFKGLVGLIDKNLAASKKYTKKECQLLSKALASQIFIVAAMGKLEMDKGQIEKTVQRVISSILN